jgi:hypothetical protein
MRHYRIRTEEAYVGWIRRFVRWSFYTAISSASIRAGWRMCSAPSGRNGSRSCGPDQRSEPCSALWMVSTGSWSASYTVPACGGWNVCALE